MVMPPMRTSSNLPFSNTRTSSGSSKRFRTVSSVAITPSRVGYAETSCITLVHIRRSFQKSSVTSASRRLNAPHSSVQPSNAKRVRRPGNLAKARLMHTPEHFIWRRKALHRCRQIRVWTSYSREQRPDCGKYFLEINAVAVSDQAARLSEIQDAAFSAGSEHPRNFAQSRVVVGQVSKTKC